MTILAMVLWVGALAQAQSNGFRVFLAGDSILNRKLSVFKDPAYLALFDRIRRADARFTNFETLIHTLQYPGPGH
jgi:poly-gamma-glutamate synthesis protein (capsule biosynthesis protein)